MGYKYIPPDRLGHWLVEALGEDPDNGELTDQPLRLEVYKDHEHGRMAMITTTSDTVYLWPQDVRDLISALEEIRKLL